MTWTQFWNVVTWPFRTVGGLMRNAGATAVILITLASLAVLAYAGALVVSFAISPWLGLFGILATAMVLVYAVCQSFYTLANTDQIMAYWFAAVWWRTYVTHDHYHDPALQAWFGRYPHLRDRVRKAAAGTFVFLPWPFVIGVRTPIEVAQVDYRASNTKTGDRSGSARVPIQIDGTLNFRLSPAPVLMLMGLRLVSWFFRDLTETITMTDNHGGTYEDTRLTLELDKRTHSQVLGAIRRAATKFSWRGRTAKGKPKLDNDIIENTGDFELRTYLELGARHSVLVNLGVLSLIEPQKDEKATLVLLNQLHKDGSFMGQSVIQLDMTYEYVDHQPLRADASEAEKADAAQFVAQQEALAGAARGEGEGRRLARLAKESGLTVQEVYQGEVAKGIDNITIISPAAGILKGIARSLGGKSKP